MPEISAEYMAGAGLDVPAPTRGRLRLGRTGLIFEGGGPLDTILKGPEVVITHQPDAIRAISLGAPDEVRRAAAGMEGYFWFGGLGGLISMASALTSLLLVAVGDPARPVVLTFAVSPEDGGFLLRAVQDERHEDGLVPLPTLEALAGPGPEQGTLTEIRDLLAAQGATLERIAELLERDRPG